MTHCPVCVEKRTLWPQGDIAFFCFHNSCRFSREESLVPWTGYCFSLINSLAIFCGLKKFLIFFVFILVSFSFFSFNGLRERKLQEFYKLAISLLNEERRRRIKLNWIRKKNPLQKVQVVVLEEIDEMWDMWMNFLLFF